MAKNNNISLHKVWLIVIVIAAIGSPFLAFATLKGDMKVTTAGMEVNRNDIKTIENQMNDPEYGIAALNGKLDVLIGLVGKIEKNIEKKGGRTKTF